MARRPLLACALAATLAATGCSSGATPDPAPPAVSGAAAAGTATGSFGGTDRAWIEINLAMNEELLRLLDLVPRHTGDAGVLAFASRIGALTQQELGALRALHAAAQMPAENQHKGMPMPGMVTDEDVIAAGAADGAAFEKMFLDLVKAHLEQGEKLAGSERTSGQEPRATALAEQMQTDRAAALKTLTELTTD